jgi:hypothetical protein
MDEHRSDFRNAAEDTQARTAAVEPGATLPRGTRAGGFDEIGYALPRPTGGVRTLPVRRVSWAGRAQARG